ncbi:MAG TPA: cyclic dehypoxanthinyl futalosine synthase [Blastocatellia bacterium]|nr:cyclic dehypoxanthinyl futalosine synthase [Blastocatellia bacterium]
MSTLATDLIDAIKRQEILSQSEWLQAATELPLEDLQQLADDVRRELHPDNIVTYVVDRNVNYTNICTSVCTFCAFYRKPGSPEGYVLSYEDIYKKVEETIALGGSGILMQGGLHPDLPLDYYTGLLRELKTRYGVHLHCFSPTEIYGLSNVTGLSYEQILRQLKDAGLDSLPGGGGEILVDEFRKRRRTECNAEEWLEVMEVAHNLHIPTTATMMFDFGEKLEHRIQHLERLHELQSRTGGFVSFIPWTFQPDNTPLGKKFPNRTAPDEYLRWLAVSRIYLRNIPNLQVSWLTQGIATGRKGLHFGANDLGSIMIEENVISPAGAHHKATENLLRQSIIDEGFVPCKRKADYVRIETVAA